ncbi:type VI secretion system baseplate subunit TssE [Roseateles sp. GG27B]
MLDRLIDHEPQNGKETLEARVLTRQQLRSAVLRDLSWLFNASRQEPESRSARKEELALWRSVELARKSTLNYGMPAFSGITLSSMDTQHIEREVAAAIRSFEPRIDPDSLSVEIKLDYGNHHNTMQLVIRGQMWSQPVPLELLLAADVDVETGNAQVRELRG